MSAKLFTVADPHAQAMLANLLAIVADPVKTRERLEELTAAEERVDAKLEAARDADERVQRAASAELALRDRERDLTAWKERIEREFKAREEHCRQGDAEVDRRAAEVSARAEALDARERDLGKQIDGVRAFVASLDQAK